MVGLQRAMHIFTIIIKFATIPTNIHIKLLLNDYRKKKTRTGAHVSYFLLCCTNIRLCDCEIACIKRLSNAN